MSLSFMRRESKYRKKVNIYICSCRKPLTRIISADQKDIRKGGQGERGEADQGAVAQGPHQGGMPDIHVNTNISHSFVTPRAPVVRVNNEIIL